MTPKEQGISKLEYKWICTSQNPWDWETLPVLHKEADFEEWPLENWLACPACGHTWCIGPDTIELP